MKKLLLTQDDCADRYAEVFERELEEKFNLTIPMFQEYGEIISNDLFDKVEYYLRIDDKKLFLSKDAGDPYWKLEEEVTPI